MYTPYNFLTAYIELSSLCMAMYTSPYPPYKSVSLLFCLSGFFKIRKSLSNFP